MFRVSLGFYSFLGFCWFFRFVFVLFLNLLSLPSPENSSWEKRIEQLLVSLEKKKGKGREGKVERECGGWGGKERKRKNKARTEESACPCRYPVGRGCFIPLVSH